LMVFLHPTILRDVETADYYSRSKYDDLRTAQLGLFEEETMLDRPAPRLPGLHLYFDGQRVKNSPSALDVPTPSLETIPSKTSGYPAINALPAQAGAKSALSGPFDSVEQ